MLPELTPEGLLPLGAHHATLTDVRRAFVRPECGDVERRRAVYAALTTWATLCRRMLGPGTILLGGGFTSSGEPDDTAIAVYVPDDDQVAEIAATSAAAVDLVSLRGVVFTYPGAGGGLDERWFVGGALDAHVTDRHTEIAYRNALSSLPGADGMIRHSAKGFVVVEVGAS